MSSVAVPDPDGPAIGTIPMLRIDALRRSGPEHLGPPIATARSGVPSAG